MATAAAAALRRQTSTTKFHSEVEGEIMVNWSPQQKQAIDQVAAWHRSYRSTGQQVFRVFGFAGTGKTTLARHFAQQIGGTTCFAAFTGKAALMMRRNGCEGASTIHGLIYQVEERGDGAIRFVLDPESAAAEAELIVIDECSMVDEELGHDLLSFGKPILVLGDPAQLPPVRSAGFFTDAKPDVMLTEIHRQAEGNPIIQLATTVRTGGRVQLGQYGESRVIERGVLTGREVLASDQVLVGKNVTRHAYNRKIRALKGFEGQLPEVGDRLVCLRNDNKLGIFNGGLFEVLEVWDAVGDPLCISMLVSSEDFARRAPVEIKVRKEFFLGGAEDLDWRDLKNTHQFDFGYALTTHKAQGSQWSDVIVYDESGTFRDEWRRWLYTAITRASDRLTLVVN
jgi:exodeoxyribonuclease V